MQRVKDLEFTSIRCRELRTFDWGRSRLSRDDGFRSGAQVRSRFESPDVVTCGAWKVL
jgi:hypothetical protein